MAHNQTTERNSRVAQVAGLSMETGALDAMTPSESGRLLLAIFFAAALANVVRVVPIGPDDRFFLPLWTNWHPGPTPAVLIGTRCSAACSCSWPLPCMDRSTSP